MFYGMLLFLFVVFLDSKLIKIGIIGYSRKCYAGGIFLRLFRVAYGSFGGRFWDVFCLVVDIFGACPPIWCFFANRNALAR